MDEQEEMLYIAASNFYVINLKPDEDSSFNLCLFTHGFCHRSWAILVVI